jgi:hypothetical protein
MDATSALSPRTNVLVKIFMPGEYFEANATVAYANPALGLGLVFRDVKPHFRTVLRKWLLMAMQLSQPSTLQGVNPQDDGATAEKEAAARSEKNRKNER